MISLYVACLIDAFFAYFICVVSAYQKAIDGEEEEEDKMEDKMEEKAASEKMAKSEMMGDGMDPPADMMDPPADGGM